MNCPKCGSSDTVLLFTSWACNKCKPPGLSATPASTAFFVCYTPNDIRRLLDTNFDGFRYNFGHGYKQFNEKIWGYSAAVDYATKNINGSRLNVYPVRLCSGFKRNEIFYVRRYPSDLNHVRVTPTPTWTHPTRQEK